MIVDLFCGGGGVSRAIRAVTGRDPDVAVNHWDVAIAVHKKNHPDTRHFLKDVREVSPLEACGGAPVDLLWASPDCRDHSRAKGGKPRANALRALPDVVPEWIAQTRPRYVGIENVPELRKWGPLDADGRPIKAFAGQYFDRWIRQIRGLGYSVDDRILTACDYGSPTRRKRLFVLARRDNAPIRWARPTHGPGLLPYHTAAECIDWSLPCPSIFGRKKPLADKTMARIAHGLKRFVFDNPQPFIVRYNSSENGWRGQGLDEPLSTLDGSNRFGLVAPVLVQSGYGERPGQAPRVLDINAPLGTLVDGQKHALCLAWLVKHFGDPNRTQGGGVVVGDHLDRPIGTVTARDHHGLSAAFLVKYRGTSDSHPGCAAIDEPLPTISAGGNRGGIHVAAIRAFLVAYYGSDGTGGQTLREPMRTVTSKARLGLVTVHGVDYQVVDIGYRMLQPSELSRATHGRFAADYDLSAARTKADQIKLLGNAVPTELAEAILREFYRPDLDYSVAA